LLIPKLNHFYQFLKRNKLNGIFYFLNGNFKLMIFKTNMPFQITKASDKNDAFVQ
jgi:hypothetical protein